MTYEEWEAEAKKAAEKSGQTWHQQNARGDYDKYVWSAQNPNDANQQFKGSYSGSGEFNGYDANYGARKMQKPGPNATPDEIRKYSWDQGWGTDDLGMVDNATIAQWIKDGKWDAQAGRFKNDYGDYVDKPTEDGPNSAGRQALFNSGNYANPDLVPAQAGGGAGGPGGGANKPPPDPVKVGNQLSLTGNPMQDMLITQFNQGQNNTFDKGNNIFGLGEDRAVGGTGANADKQSQIQGQSLTGGGVWWGQGTDAFGGWNAAEDKQLAGTKATGEQNQAAQQYDPNVKLPSATQPTQTTSKPVDPRRPTSPTTTYYAGGNMNQKPPDQSRTIAGMMTNSFSGNA
jgi:hypothetical protein